MDAFSVISIVPKLSISLSLSFPTMFSMVVCLASHKYLSAGIPSVFHDYVIVELSHFWLFVTPRPVACQASLSMGFSRHKYWSGLLFPIPGNLPEPEPLASPALADGFFTTTATWEALPWLYVVADSMEMLPSQIPRDVLPGIILLEYLLLRKKEFFLPSM